VLQPTSGSTARSAWRGTLDSNGSTGRRRSSDVAPLYGAPLVEDSRYRSDAAQRDLDAGMAGKQPAAGHKRTNSRESIIYFGTSDQQLC
jgi:hypothetical protein